MSGVELLANVDYFVENGYVIISDFYSSDEIHSIKSLLDGYLLKHSTKPHAIREVLLKIPALKTLVFSENLISLISIIEKDAFVCKSIFFDKTVDANWSVNWHQDISIHVSKKIDTDGFYAWTNKDNVIGVCAPAEILQKIFTIRIHIDDADESNGALQITQDIQYSVLLPKQIKSVTSQMLPITCNVHSGGIHIMKPLLLHSSCKSVNNKQRRVIHLEFTTKELPNGLSWAEKMRLK